MNKRHLRRPRSTNQGYQKPLQRNHFREFSKHRKKLGHPHTGDIQNTIKTRSKKEFLMPHNQNDKHRGQGENLKSSENKRTGDIQGLNNKNHYRLLNPSHESQEGLV